MYTILALTSLLAIGGANLNCNAQSVVMQSAPASPSSIDSCTQGCLTQALTQGPCNSITNLTCVCTNNAYHVAASNCLQVNCTTADVSAALALQMSECASIVGGSSSASASGANSSSGSISFTLNSGSSAGAFLVAAIAMVGGAMMVF